MVFKSISSVSIKDDRTILNKENCVKTFYCLRVGSGNEPSNSVFASAVIVNIRFDTLKQTKTTKYCVLLRFGPTCVAKTAGANLRFELLVPDQ